MIVLYYFMIIKSTWVYKVIKNYINSNLSTKINGLKYKYIPTLDNQNVSFTIKIKKDIRNPIMIICGSQLASQQEIFLMCISSIIETPKIYIGNVEKILSSNTAISYESEDDKIKVTISYQTSNAWANVYVKILGCDDNEAFELTT